jgi:hypothetical protein
VDINPQEGDLVLIGDNYYYNRSLIDEDVVIQFEWSEELSSFENNNINVTPNNLEFLDLTQDGNTYSMTIEAEELEDISNQGTIEIKVRADAVLHFEKYR